MYSFEGATIVYCRTRKMTEEVTAILKSKKKSERSGKRGKKKRSIHVRSGIRTHAYKSRLRPERSALDHSAILTACVLWLLSNYLTLADAGVNCSKYHAGLSNDERKKAHHSFLKDEVQVSRQPWTCMEYTV